MANPESICRIECNGVFIPYDLHKMHAIVSGVYVVPITWCRPGWEEFQKKLEDFIEEYIMPISKVPVIRFEKGVEQAIGVPSK